MAPPLQRSARVRPTTRGLLVALCAVVSVAAAQYTGWYAFLAFSAALAAVLLASGISMARSLRGVEIRRELSPVTPTQGEVIEIGLRVSDARPHRSPFVFEDTIGDVTRKIGVARADPASWDTPWRIRARRRGMVFVGPGTVWRQDPLRLFLRRGPGAPRQSLIVRPAGVELSGAVLLRRSGLDAERQFVRSHERGDTRPYVPGDDPRRVNWKATSRVSAQDGSLMVSDDDRRDSGDDVVVLLSIDELPAGPDRELALSTTASILRALAPLTRAVLEIERRGRTLHVDVDLGENLEALATVEYLEMEGQDARLAAHRPRPVVPARQERRAGIAVAGPGGTADGGLLVVCDTAGRDTALQGVRNADAVVVRDLTELLAAFAPTLGRVAP